MTEEEIRPIAENYVEEYCHCSDGEYTDGDLVCAGIGTALIVSRQLEKRIAELKADNDARKFAMAMSEKVETQLREENAELKTDYEVLSCSVGDFGELQDRLEEEQRKNNGLSDNLTKAKTYLKYFIEILKKLGANKEPLVIEAEQFISEVKK